MSEETVSVVTRKDSNPYRRSAVPYVTLKLPVPYGTGTGYYNSGDFFEISLGYSWDSNKIFVKVRHSQGRLHERNGNNIRSSDYTVWTYRLTEGGEMEPVEHLDGENAEMLLEIPEEHPVGEVLKRFIEDMNR